MCKLIGEFYIFLQVTIKFKFKIDIKLYHVDFFQFYRHITNNMSIVSTRFIIHVDISYFYRHTNIRQRYDTLETQPTL